MAVTHTALLIVDVQRDFCQGGVLAACDSDSLIVPLRQFACLCAKVGVQVYATRDWHPVNHGSFVEQGGPWPKHCLAESLGAEFHPELILPANTKVVSKGIDPDESGYSAFSGTNLACALSADQVTHVAVAGIATEYCIHATAIDSLTEGFHVTVLEDLVRPVERDMGKSRRALLEITENGGQVKMSSEWLDKVLER